MPPAPVSVRGCVLLEKPIGLILSGAAFLEKTACVQCRKILHIVYMCVCVCVQCFVSAECVRKATYMSVCDLHMDKECL